MVTTTLMSILLVTGSFNHARDTMPRNDSIPVSTLQEVMISANREGVRRSEAPVAIAKLNSRIIEDSRASSIDQLLNKVSGVNMVDLGNEQHQMSIRQPMTTKSLFLYLDDGIPIRTSGLFNHNALLEINMASVKNIEVIKGPSSSLYGSEAIGGVVNFISASPSTVPVARLALSGSNLGYRRQEGQISFQTGKWGISTSGYHAQKHNTYLEFSDFRKSTFTAKVEYRISAATTFSNKVTWLDYYSDMPGGIDSAMFAQKQFKNPHTFTYRKVRALRYHSTLLHKWSEKGRTSVTAIYRSNQIEQNPAYRIKDDYRKREGQWSGRKDLAHGEINLNQFNSYAFIAQHKQSFDWKKTVLIAGASGDISPSGYNARYISITKDTASQKYTRFDPTDSILSSYSTRITNYASYVNFEMSPLQRLRVVASLRYDLFRYGFNNELKGTAFSGSADTINDFSRVSSKIGATYNFSTRTGVYANYSEGFIPPQVTEMYTGVKVPRLEPSIAKNYEAGGWAELIPRKMSLDLSLYRLISTNEVVSTRLDDGSFANTNAGKTSHQGIELAITAFPAKTLSARFSGAYSKHRFVNFVEKGETYDGKEMNGAPNWMFNTEVWYKPGFLPGFRIGAELQHIGKYFTDPKNTSTYDGYILVNVRMGYRYKQIEIWLNALNVTNTYYATIANKSAFGYSYSLGEPASIHLGLSYDFGKLFN